MARPPRAERPAKKIVYVRMSPEEIERLDERREPTGLSRSDFLRRRGLKMRTQPIPLVESQTATQLGQVSNNLNQLSRALNALKRDGRASVGETEIEGLREQLSALSAVSDELRSQILNRGDDDADR